MKNLCATFVLSGACFGLFNTGVLAQQNTVIELFTSQACPTCRPAEALIEKLADREDVLALAFHVDYWDYTGWADPFAKKAYSTRQQAYLQRVGVPFVTTPQFVVNGQPQLSDSSSEWVGQTLDSRTFALTGKPQISVRMVEQNVVQINIGPADLSIRSSVSLVRFTRSLSTRVTSGDNNGRELNNAN